MSKKIRVRRTKPASVAPAVAKPAAKVIEPVEEQEVESNDDDYRMWNIADLQAELKNRSLPSDGRKSAMVARLEADDAGESAEPEEEEADDDTDDSASEEGVVAGSLSDLFDALNDGTSVTITKLGKDKWQFVTGIAATAAPVSAPKGRGLTGMVFAREAYSEEFFKWHFEDAGSGKPWGEMTSEERYAFAEEIGASWEEHDEPRVDAMRMGQAVREKLDISKWKPEYESRAARKALKG